MSMARLKADLWVGPLHYLRRRSTQVAVWEGTTSGIIEETTSGFPSPPPPPPPEPLPPPTGIDPSVKLKANPKLIIID